MQFVEPFLLWGAMAVVIPIVIHFWHQKRGQPLPWAATQWLTERDQQQSRGLRLDNIPLLLLRCLLLLVLAVLLSQLILSGLNNQQTIQRVHLIQPDPLLAESFRFELDEAAKKGEKAYWIDPANEPFESSRPAKKLTAFNPLTLQTAINRLPTETTELHLYVVNEPSLATVPVITVPPRFRLHTTPDSTTPPRAFLAVRANRKLFVNRAGKLVSSTVVDPTLKFQSASAHSDAFRVLLNYPNPRERQTVRAALASLAEVYAIDFTIDEKQIANRAYDLVFTDNRTQNAPTSPTTRYVVSGGDRATVAANVVSTPEPLTPQTSDLVATGRLPEWIGEQLIRQYNLNPTRYPLSQRVLKTLFVPSTTRTNSPQPLVQNVLLLLLVVLALLERGVALTKNA